MIDFKEVLNSAQISTALLIICFLLFYIAFGKRSKNQERHSKNK